MQIERPGASGMANYVVVEVTCRVFGRARAKLLADSWLGNRSCPKCKGRCECVYLGHGFTSDNQTERKAAGTGVAQHYEVRADLYGSTFAEGNGPKEVP